MCAYETNGSMASGVLRGHHAVYTAAFTAAFSDLPLNIPPWHQLLLLYFHAFPMFFLQLLLCRRARAVWRLLVPLALLAVQGCSS